MFNAECRDLIKKAIVDHFFALGKGTLHTRHFEKMLRIILAELPDEDPRIWFCAAPQHNKLCVSLRYVQSSKFISISCYYVLPG